MKTIDIFLFFTSVLGVNVHAMRRRPPELMFYY